MRLTCELQPGDRVVLPGPAMHVVRTVATVGPHPDPLYVNHRGERIWLVTYTEGRTQQWGSGNLALADTWWHTATPTEGGSS